jgi:hypothetical protein
MRRLRDNFVFDGNLVLHLHDAPHGDGHDPEGALSNDALACGRQRVSGERDAERQGELLKKDGKTVDAHYYANEGHGFEKRENQIDSIRRSIEWFDKYLK